jgi:hypothetical protein
MGLLELMSSLGDRLGIIEKQKEANALKPAKIQTRSVTLAELTSEVKSDEVQALADLPAELTVSYDRIFEASGIKPSPNGWNIDRLRQLLETDPFKGKERADVQRRIVEVLSKEHVEPEHLVKDAVARDQALDAFEAFAKKKVQDRTGVLQHKLAEIESQIEALRKEQSKLKEQLALDEEKWRAWRRQKRAVERELAATVSFLIDRPIITTDNEV